MTQYQPGAVLYNPWVGEQHMASGQRILTDTTITLEFSDGRTFGPIEKNETTLTLTAIIGELVERVLSLEAKTAHLDSNRS